MIEQRTRRVLGVAWWVILPPFMLLIGRFAYERACLNPSELLQPTATIVAKRRAERLNELVMRVKYTGC